ncbi:Hypothetical predicted protein [Paramuricea clavata]|uniref:Uncharacterized protein n=1 Tax=Paramuricea clavata TaxID=317549 RepID=A0A7D9HXB2_PARCT|nr:Hypothetical predicted protein [Paramuricea clavata]
MPTDVMLSPVVVIPQDQNTYAKELLVKLSKAREYTAAITKELRHKQKEYYDLGRKTTHFLVGDLVVVRRTQRSGQTGIAAKWLPRWTGPYRIVEQMPNGDNYRLEHVEAAKILDPTKVDKLIKVEPWSVNESNPGQTNPNKEDTPPEISQSHRNPQSENGSFIVYEKLGDFFDDDIRAMIEELHAWLKSQKDHKSSTGEVPLHKKSRVQKDSSKHWWNSSVADSYTIDTCLRNRWKKTL